MLSYTLKRLMMILSVLLFFTACTSQGFNYVVRVSNFDTNSPIENASVTLEISDAPPKIRFTDSEGTAIIHIESSRLGQIGKITVLADDYQPYTRNFEIEQGGLPSSFRLKISNAEGESIAIIGEDADLDEPDKESIIPSEPTATETPTRVPTHTPSPTPTQLPTVTLSPTPTLTATPTPTWTHTPTPQLEEDDDTTQLIVSSSRSVVNLYTKPSITEGAVRAWLKSGWVLMVMDESETQGEKWYKVRVLENDLEGWVEEQHVERFDGTLTATPTPIPGMAESTVIPSSCLIVSIERMPIPARDFDTITLRYSNWPAGTVDFAFEVYTIPQGGGIAYLVEPTLTDTGTTFYEMAYTRFEDRGFQPYTPFTYALQPRNATGQVLCTASGSFTNP